MLFSGVNADIIAYFRESLQKGIAMLFNSTANANIHCGGFNWQSFAYALWEAFFCIGFSIGIIALFRKKLNVNNKFTQLLADNSFCLYVFHPPVQVAILLSLKNLVLAPWLKFLVALIIALTACLVFCILIRKIKIIRILFK
jgi:peptidoglycan/LPS O-acetylase OafA/YrhL